MYVRKYVCLRVDIFVYVYTDTPTQVVYFDSSYICATNHKLTDYCRLLLHHQTNKSILTAISQIYAILLTVINFVAIMILIPGAVEVSK